MERRSPIADPFAILFVPTEEHREALLHRGPCGARPPMAQINSLLVGDKWVPIWVEVTYEYRPGFALVLAWEDKSVLEGLERLHHHATEFSLAEKCRWKWNLKAPSDWMVPDQVFEVVQVARLAEEMGLGTVVCLDAEGKEISDG